jgi:indole-3-glycerol phosphate synthase/phosphoribosylanthranilate isomerase
VSQKNIRQEIVERRRTRIAAEGYGLGVDIPAGRTVPIVDFTRQPLAICEIKRRSPSRGDIAPGLDPVEQARRYVAAGIQSVSILTEEDHFNGSLRDLMAVKHSFPGLGVLRKDFLVDENDVVVSWRAGADAVLLIASMLGQEELARMIRRAESLHMSALVEVHSRADIEKIRPLYPALVGINCRNLENFQIDRLLPVGRRPFINWEAQVVFESGIFSYEDALYAQTHNFQGILVGEAVVRRPEVIPELIRGVGGELTREGGMPPRPWLFWQYVGDLLEARGLVSDRPAGKPVRPLVKICGITRVEDGVMAAELGADLLGFVFAPSPRRATADVVRALTGLPVLKVAVVVGEVPDEVRRLMEEGLIDAIQFSGDERPAECFDRAWPYYKALKPQAETDLAVLEDWRCPRVLLDAWSAGAHGGTGKRLDPALVSAAAAKVPLWLAGGIGPDNVAGIIRDHQPELVDLSSSLESEPGKKDRAKLERFFAEIRGACPE